MDERHGYDPGSEIISNNNHDEPVQPAHKSNNDKAVGYGCHMRGHGTIEFGAVRWIHDGYGCCADTSRRVTEIRSV